MVLCIFPTPYSCTSPTATLLCSVIYCRLALHSAGAAWACSTLAISRPLASVRGQRIILECTSQIRHPVKQLQGQINSSQRHGEYNAHVLDLTQLGRFSLVNCALVREKKIQFLGDWMTLLRCQTRAEKKMPEGERKSKREERPAFGCPSGVKPGLTTGGVC